MTEKFPIKQISRILKTKIGKIFLSLLVVLSFFTSILIIHSINSEPTALISCNDTSAPLFTADGSNNCLVYLTGLPKGEGSTDPGITLPACVVSNNPYRVNCADPIHLPLCNPIGENNNLKDCIKECETSESDYHNISCIKFCDGSKIDRCVDRKCHQPKEILRDGSPSGTFQEPSSTNCKKISCNLLTPGELSVIAKICNIHNLYKNPPSDVSKLSEADKLNLYNSSDCFEKYCETKDSENKYLKCYQYSKDQLPVTKILNCDLHDCDYKNPDNRSETISDSDIVKKNTGYKSSYCKNVKTINDEKCSDSSLSNFSAETKYCKSATILKLSYSCTKANESDSEFSVRNDKCTTDCDKGSCFQEVICGSGSFNPLCSPPAEVDAAEVNALIESKYEQKIGSQHLLSFFNRPTPPSSSYKESYMKAINNKYRGGDATRNGGISSSVTFICINSENLNSSANSSKCTNNSPTNSFGEKHDSRGYCCSSGERVMIDADATNFKSEGPILEELGGYDACGTFYQQLGSGSYSPPYRPKNHRGNSFHNVGTVPGSGYSYLCGNKSDVYTKVSEETAYFKGYPIEDWTTKDLSGKRTINDLSGKRKIKVNVCLRYRNSFYPWGDDTCGERSCVRSCLFFKDQEQNTPCFEYCGTDKCKVLEIDESNGQECSMNDGFLGENPKNCAQLMDNVGMANGYLRLRAVYYGTKVCAFLDVKGQLAYNDNLFIKPDDKIPMTQREMDELCKGRDPEECKKKEETCITGRNEDGKCMGAFDTTANMKKSLASVFRPMLRVQYTGSLFGVSEKITGVDSKVPGYYDVSGRFVEEMPCAPVEPRIAPPSQFNLADYRNSSKIFEPPLFISGFTPSINNSEAVDFFEPELQVTYGSTILKLKLSKGVKQGVVIDGSQLADIQQKNKNCSSDNSNEVRLLAIKSLAEIGETINCDDPKLNEPKYYKYIIDDDIPLFGKKTYKNQHDNFEIKDIDDRKIMSYVSLENEQLGKLTRNTYYKSENTFSLTDNKDEDIRVQKSITLQTVFNQSIIKKVTVFLKRKESLNNPQICLMRREFFAVGDDSELQTKDYEVSCIAIDKTQLNLSVYGKSNGTDEKIDLGSYIESGTNIIDKIGKIYANKKIYYRYDVPKHFNSNYNTLNNINYYGEEYYLSSPESSDNYSCDVNSSLNLNGDKQNILLGSDKYVVCAQRSYCSTIYNECIASYIQKNRKEILGKNTSIENQTINNCKELESTCKSLMHFKDDGSNFPSPYSSDSYKTYSRDKEYSGWFNEICLTERGLEHLFSKKVVVYNKFSTGNNFNSACVAKLSDCKTSDCSCYDPDGIKCLCVEADLDGKLPDEYKNTTKFDLRKKNPHEAGFCVNMPILKSCRALTYKTKEERTKASDVGNAEFDVSFPSMQKIKGECKGNWNNPNVSQTVYGECNMLNSTGNIITAEGSSTEQYNDANNRVAFSKTNGNCIRNSCPAITAGMYSKPYPTISTEKSAVPIYNPNFLVEGEIGDNIGKTFGFSNWQTYLKIKDDDEEVASSYFEPENKIHSCMPGYKIKNAIAAPSPTEYMSIDLKLLKKEVYKKITHYSYLTENLPKRKCNDAGHWTGIVTNACEQIKCPAIKPPSPLEDVADAEKSTRITQWANINGAEFEESLASRTIESDRNNIVGKCNLSIGYETMPGGDPPSRECDYLGNWGPVKNPCSGKCDAINSDIGSHGNNGYAEWPNVEEVSNGKVKIVGAIKCIAGYLKYPYSVYKIFSNTSTFNLTVGEQYPASILFDDAGDATNEIKNRESSSDSATQLFDNNGLPIRGCFNSPKAHSIFGTTSSGKWLKPLSICINKCPSGDLDPRIGIGITEHNSSAGKVRITWPATDFNTIVVAYGQINDPNNVRKDGVIDLHPTFSQTGLPSRQLVTDYTDYARENGKYLIIRYCGKIPGVGGMAGKWGSVRNGCSPNSDATKEITFKYAVKSEVNKSEVKSDEGVLVNDSREYIATQTSLPDPNFPNDIGSTLNEVSCNGSNNYYKANKDTSLAPSYQCSNNLSSDIDKTYYSRVGGDACVQYCKLTANQVVDLSTSNNTSDIYLDVRGKQPATCKKSCGSGEIECDSSYKIQPTGCHTCKGCNASSLIEHATKGGTTKRCIKVWCCPTKECLTNKTEQTPCYDFKDKKEIIESIMSHGDAPLNYENSVSMVCTGTVGGVSNSTKTLKINITCVDGKKILNDNYLYLNPE